MKKDEFEAIAKSLEEVKSKFKIVADVYDADSAPAVSYSDIDYLHRRCSDCVDRIYKLYDEVYKMFAEHTQNHLPPIQTPSQMEKAIKALGLDKDYDVQKRTIWASDGTVDKYLLEITKK